MNLQEMKSYYNTKPVEFVPKIKENYDLKEDREYIPRFKLKNIQEIAGVPINKPLTPTGDLFVKAIKYGMIFLVTYKGAKDNHSTGHERVIYPMVYGRSSKGKHLIRGWHLNGWSVSADMHINKVWRMFRFDRVKSITFTGSFYRLPPSGYNAMDKGMRGGIIARADFNEIRRNQQTLVKRDEIQNREEVTMGSQENKFATVRVKATDTKLDVTRASENAYINNIKDMKNLRISFLKSIYADRYVSIIGAMGQPGNTVKLIDDKNNNLGVYKVIDSTDGETLMKIKRVKNNGLFDLYIFVKKI